MTHQIEDGDGVCGDCAACQENIEPDTVDCGDLCAWCGHCLGTVDQAALPNE